MKEKELKLNKKYIPQKGDILFFKVRRGKKIYSMELIDILIKPVLYRNQEDKFIFKLENKFLYRYLSFFAYQKDYKYYCMIQKKNLERIEQSFDIIIEKIEAKDNHQEKTTTSYKEIASKKQLQKLGYKIK